MVIWTRLVTQKVINEKKKKKKKIKNTRVTDKSKTIIDRAFVSNPVWVSSAGVYCLGLSDH